MAITINWATSVINIPKSDTTLIQAVPTEIRELDLNSFRLILKELEDTEEGMTFPKTHNHNTEVSVSGVTLARVIEILDPYSITFEDDQYAVNLVGANSNVADKVNVNQVSIRSSNSAGLITIAPASGSGAVTLQDIADIADAVWNEQIATHTDPGSTGLVLSQVGTGSIHKAKVIGTGTTTSFTTNLTESTNNFYVNQSLRFVTGDLAGQTRNISTYDGTTKILTFYKPFTSVPNNNDNFELVTNFVNPTSDITEQLDIVQAELALIKGLVKHNFKMTNLVYNAGNKMTSAKMKIYPTTLDTQNDTSPIAIYDITAQYNLAGQLIDYKVVPE